MCSSIQPSILIKGRAALPRSQWACLIFHPLSRIKKEGTYKLERVWWSLGHITWHLEIFKQTFKSCFPVTSPWWRFNVCIRILCFWIKTEIYFGLKYTKSLFYLFVLDTLDFFLLLKFSFASLAQYDFPYKSLNHCAILWFNRVLFVMSHSQCKVGICCPLLEISVTCTLANDHWCMIHRLFHRLIIRFCRKASWCGHFWSLCLMLPAGWHTVSTLSNLM